MPNITIFFTHQSTRHPALTTWIRQIKIKKNHCIYMSCNTRGGCAYACRLLSEDPREKLELASSEYTLSKEAVLDFIYGVLAEKPDSSIEEIYCEGNLTEIAGEFRCNDAHYFLDALIFQRVYIFTETSECVNAWKDYFNSGAFQNKAQWFAGDLTATFKKRQEVEAAMKEVTAIESEELDAGITEEEPTSKKLKEIGAVMHEVVLIESNGLDARIKQEGFISKPLGNTLIPQSTYCSRLFGCLRPTKKIHLDTADDSIEDKKYTF